MANLLTPELLRRLEQFQLLAARRAKSSTRAERPSRARGQSVEFADHRSYVHSDDFRYLGRFMLHEPDVLGKLFERPTHRKSIGEFSHKLRSQLD